MKGDPNVLEYINSASSPYKEVMLRLRELIFEIVPDVTEAIKWGMPVFNRGKNICYLAVSKKHVTFSFYDGRMLKDPDGILEGTGKMMRHIKLRNMDNIDEERIKRWILEGFYF